VGELTNSKEQARGKLEEVEGKARENLGKAQRRSGEDYKSTRLSNGRARGYP